MSDDKPVIALPGDAHEGAEQTAYANQVAAEKLAKEQESPKDEEESS